MSVSTKNRWVRSGRYLPDERPMWRIASESEVLEARSRDIPQHWVGPVGSEPVGGSFAKTKLGIF